MKFALKWCVVPLLAAALVAQKAWRDRRRHHAEPVAEGDAARPPSRLAFAAGCFATVTFCALARIFFRSEEMWTSTVFE